MVVEKRDGRKTEFNKDKIRTAVLKAFLDVDGEETQYAKEKARDIANYIEGLGKDLSVEEIQDIVEDKLMASNRKDVARAYIKYRYDRSQVREKNTQLMKDISDKILAKNIQNQNANIDEKSFGGRTGEATDSLMKKYALEYCVSDMAKNNHLNNEIYIHDLSSYAVGCHNCTDGDSWITIKHDGDIKTVRIEDFANDIQIEDGQIAYLEKGGYQILSRDGWTKLNNITKRKLGETEKLYYINTRTGLPLKLTGDHRLPIIRDGAEIVEYVKNLSVGDELISADNVLLSKQEIQSSFLNMSEINDDNMDIRITNLSPLKNYLRYKYGVMFSVYATNNFSYYNGHTQESIKLDDFLNLIEEYPLSFDVLSKLKISSSGSKHKYPLLIPYTASLAKLYAYIYSDGSVYEKEDGSMFQVMFANTNEKIVDDFIDCFETCFGRKLNKCYPSEEYKVSNSPCIRVHCGDKIIVRLFKKFAGGLMNGSSNLKIPEFITNGTDEIKYAYLSAAIDCDGSLCSNNINVSSCCKEYCEQLVMMINSLGYHSTIIKTGDAGDKYHFRKSNRTGTRNFDSYSVRVYRADEMAELYSKMCTIKYSDSYSYKGISHNFVENKIVSIYEKEGLKISVYDFETASHWYILNNYVSHNCLTIPFDELLADGFNTRQTDVRPAQSVSTAFQLVAVIFQLQSLQQFGGVSASHLDWTMVPYVRKSFYKHYMDGMKYLYDMTDFKNFPVSKDDCGDFAITDLFYQKYEKAYKYAMDMTEKEVRQAVEGMYHNLNTLQSRSGNQLPFTSINYGTCTELEGRMVTKALLDVSIKGIGKLHKTSIFPCGIFQMMDGVNRKDGDPNYDLYRLALKSTAQRLYPNYSNCDWTGNEGYDKNDPKTYFSTMGKCKMQPM